MRADAAPDDPAARFAERLAELAPEVTAEVLQPGASLDIRAAN
jgi:hypothetical protein